MRMAYLRGAVDLHVHSAPDVTPRIASCVEIAAAAADAGMRAIVLKDHDFPSYVKAVITDEVVPGIAVFGGITLNSTAGGINLRSVRAAVTGGAKVVMFPTFDTAPAAAHPESAGLALEHSFGRPLVPLRAVGEDGKLAGDTEAILEFVATRPDLVLSNGHLPVEESVALMERAHEAGIRRLVIEHPNAEPRKWTREFVARLSAIGVCFNLSYAVYSPVLAGFRFSELVEMVELIGPGHCALISDGGQPYNPMPHVTLNMMCEMLQYKGVPAAHIERMVKENPASVLGLDG